MEKVIANNLKLIYGFPADDCVQSVIKVNETISIGTMDALFGQDNDLGDHPCMDGMWY